MKTLIAAAQIDCFAPLEQTLLPEGFGPFIKTTTAARALELLDSPPEGAAFDCILLDARLCENGFRLLERIKDLPGTADTPILLLVPADDPGLGEQGMLAGAHDFCVLSADFTELTLRMKLLRRSLSNNAAATGSTIFLQTILDAMPSLFLRLSSTGRILDANRAFRQITGLTTHQLQETFLLQRFCFGEPNVLKERIENVLASDIPALGIELAAEFSADLSRWYLADLIPVRQQTGCTQSLLFFASDITKSKITGYALKESETRYRNLFDRLPVAIIEQDFSHALAWLETLREKGIKELRPWLQEHPHELEKILLQTKLVGTNELSLPLFEVKSQYQFALLADRLLYGLNPEIGLEQIMALWENSWRVEFETQVQTLQGKPIHCIAKFLRIEENLNDGDMILVLLDVSKLKRAEKVLRRSEARYRAIVEDQTELICRFLPEGGLSFVNGAFARYYHKDHEKLTGALFESFMPAKDARPIREMIAGLTPTNPVATFENRTERPDRSISWLQWTLRAIYDRRNRLSEYQAVGQDVTWRKCIEHELQAAKEAAEQASHIKSTFLATVSHEVRTPLTAILGFSELLQAQKDLAPDILQSVGRIAQAGERLLALINDVLDLSKIEAGKLEIEENDFSPSAMITDVAGMFVHPCRKKTVQLKCELDEALPAWIWGPEKRLHQVLTNLLSNAVKFTEQGEVRLQVQMPSERRAAFTVSDTGIGIAPDQLESIFDHFTQAGSFVTRKYGGTGLGLSISKRLVAMMGGTLSVASVPGKGSTFQFAVDFFPPHSPQPRSTDESAPPRQFANLKILLVDDDRSNREIAKAFLLGRGHCVETANDGARAVELREQNTYDLILMDVQMAPMDGMEATRRIRDWEEKNNAVYTPIIALTAHAMKGDRERFLHAGMDGYGSKPFNFKKLVNVISEVLSRARDDNGRLLPAGSCPYSGADSVPAVVPDSRTTNRPDNVRALSHDAQTPSPLVLNMELALSNMSPRIWRIGAQVFLEDMPPQLDALRTHIKASELGQAKALAHKLKGASGNIGAESIRLLFLAMEEAAGLGDAARTRELIGPLLDCWLQTRQKLQMELDAAQ